MRTHAEILQDVGALKLSPHERRCLRCGCKTISENGFATMACCKSPISDHQLRAALLAYGRVAKAASDSVQFYAIDGIKTSETLKLALAELDKEQQP